jgi:hypothetical protein
MSVRLGDNKRITISLGDEFYIKLYNNGDHCDTISTTNQ